MTTIQTIKPIDPKTLTPEQINEIMSRPILPLEENDSAKITDEPIQVEQPEEDPIQVEPSENVIVLNPNFIVDTKGCINLNHCPRRMDKDVIDKYNEYYKKKGVSYRIPACWSKWYKPTSKF